MSPIAGGDVQDSWTAVSDGTDKRQAYVWTHVVWNKSAYGMLTARLGWLKETAVYILEILE